MRILIIEDDDDKRNDLIGFMRDTYLVTEILSARSLQSGLREALNSVPDLILLDMTMRNFDRTLSEDGGRPHPFAGREILRQMRRCRIPSPVLVVTHFDRFGEESDYMTLVELKADLVSKFPNYIGTVQYRSNVDDWKPAIIAAIGERLQRR